MNMVYGKMSSQLVSLAWDGHHRTLVSVFEKLLVNSYFVNCTIAAEGQKMKAHKEVLSAFSPFFELLFREETAKNPTMIISGISFRDLRSLVDFIYQGKLEVTEDRIQDLIDAAECLQIKGLGGGHKENSSDNTNNTTVSPERQILSSGIPHKRTRKGKMEETAKGFSKESDVNNLKYRSEMQPENSLAITSVTKETSHIQTPISNCDVQNVPIVSSLSSMPSQSTPSEMDMGSLHLCGESVVKKEPESDGDENINEPMSDLRRGRRVCGNNGNSCKNSDDEPILGLISDISVPSENNVYEDLPSDCFSPAELLSTKECSRDLIVSSAKNELRNINVNLCSESVDPVVSAVDTQDPLLHSQFHIKMEEETLLSVDDDLITENGEFSENTSENIGVPCVLDMLMKVARTEKENDISGAVLSKESVHSLKNLLRRLEEQNVLRQRWD